MDAAASALHLTDRPRLAGVRRPAALDLLRRPKQLGIGMRHRDALHRLAVTDDIDRAPVRNRWNQQPGNAAEGVVEVGGLPKQGAGLQQEREARSTCFIAVMS